MHPMCPRLFSACVTAARRQPAAVRATRPAGFTNEPTKEITRAAVAAALGGAKGVVAVTDENVAPAATSSTPRASGGVVRPTPKVAVASASAASHTPKPPLSLTRPTAASAAKSTSKAAATPRGAASSSKVAAAPAGSCSKCTPTSAGAKTATRTSLGGRTPTVTMTCRCEALDMLDKQGETLEASFNDGDVSLNASQDKSSEVDSSQSSAAASSSGSDGNQVCANTSETCIKRKQPTHTGVSLSFGSSARRPPSGCRRPRRR